MTIEKELEKLLEFYGSDLHGYAWSNEDDRWKEFVFCIVNQCQKLDPAFIRACLNMLQDLNLLEVNTLADLNQNDEERIVIYYLFKKHGFSEENAEKAVKIIIDVSKIIQNQYNGKIQKYLRIQGEKMVDELSEKFSEIPLENAQIRFAMSHWLQNVISAPISLKNDAMTEFCEKNATNEEEILQAADKLNLNMALVDDLLDMDQNYTKDI